MQITDSKMRAHGQAEGKVYRTADLYFAAFLKTAGVELDDLVRDENGKRRVIFVFKDEGQIKDLYKGYHHKGVSIGPALQFVQNIRGLKNQTAEIMENF